MGARDWRDLPRAPAPGAPVCTAGALAEPGTLGLDLGGFPLLLVRTGIGLFGYFNACPHQHLPLDWRGGRVLSADERLLRCSNHAAGFDAATGQGVEGLGQGCVLIPVPIEETGGEIRIGSS
ncbi:nitrite reductase/ring-hydroxylating ferredoxin subunit [Limimaricola soesokkakensis]|uniref:Nitrite reductase/ring-hydroxylating ferredoxin subunit n=1 Tax=Limimaricola soesokkakensis TaxID=1343159 RepID=A0A1X6Y6P7_9RHOB|nr:Rieske 2Fe-2S domain-containing protein [Limimaricola soesokkakensis]PSK87305.1 nitrite reductase/ring-hydroxylating ferredoxin subunit [Limimaricola soesokkakensis]SLN12239.1 Rieske [2Fe-2S] domain protein [Limimaricola soesokkakensis]